jgi:regulatory protein
VSDAGPVPAARSRSRRRRWTGAGRGPSPAVHTDSGAPVRIAAVRGGPASAAANGAGELRLIVLVDGRRFRADAEEAVRFGLEPGAVIDPAVFALLERRDAYRRGRDMALRLLGVRPRSTAELRGRLARAGVEPGVSASVIAALANEGYLNDLEFARAWVRSRLLARPCGALRLRHELREKGVAGAVIEQAIREVDGEQDGEAAEERRARELAERRLRASAGLAWDVRVRRLAALLERRGFAAPTIAHVLRTVQRYRGETSDA